MTVPFSEIQSLTPSAVVELFVLDATALGGSVYRFHAGTNGLGTGVVWQGNTYSPMPIQAEGFEWSSQGVLPRPKLRVAAMDGVVGGLIHSLDDLVGARITLKRTHAKFLDSANFPGGSNPTADPNACYPDEPFIVERKTLETKDLIEFELASPMDVQNARIPKRRVQAKVCPWAYKGAECGYSGGLSTCAKTLADCKNHFGATADLPFGGFPGTAKVR